MSRTAVLLPVLLLLVIIPGAVFGATVSSLTITVYKDDKVLADATVELWYNGTLAFRGVTDTNGTVSFSNVTTGNYTIYVYYAGKAYTFEEIINESTTSITLNITDDTVGYLIGLSSAPFWGKVSSNPVLLYTGVGVILVILLLLAYAFSGRKVPRRR